MNISVAYCLLHSRAQDNKPASIFAQQAPQADEVHGGGRGAVKGVSHKCACTLKIVLCIRRLHVFRNR